MLRTTVVLALSLVLPLSARAELNLLHHSFAVQPTARALDATRIRFVEPDVAALESLSLAQGERVIVKKSVRLALFDDATVDVLLEHAERDATGAITWRGRIEGDASSAVTLSALHGALAGSVSTATQRYLIEPVANGGHVVIDVDFSAFPDESEPVRVHVAPSEMRSESLAPMDAGTTIDILVAWTDDLRASLGSTDAAQAAAASAIAATNVAFANSGVIPRVRLAGTAEVNITDSADFGPLLEALRGDRDGQMDELHAIRNRIGADAVVLLTLYGGTSCGASYLMTSPSADFAQSAFAIVANRCAVASLSFPHELGHVFGLEHDRYAAPDGSPAYPYGYGYVDVAGQFRDIMSYSYACSRCPRIQYFSNPLLTYLSRPLGISYESARSASADNVRALNNAAPIIANWRTAAPSRTRAVRR